MNQPAQDLKTMSDSAQSLKASLHEHSKLISMLTELGQRHMSLIQDQCTTIKLLSDRLTNVEKTVQENKASLVKKLDNLVSSVIGIALIATVVLYFLK